MAGSDVNTGGTATRVIGAIVGVIVALNASVYLLERVTGGPGPAGPASSSFATAPEGLAAYADLLLRSGHRVVRLREDLDRAPLAPDATLVIFDAPALAPPEVVAVRDWLEAGGRLVAGGSDAEWVASVTGTSAVWSFGGSRVWHPIVPTSEAGGVMEVRSAGRGSWSEPGDALPVLADGDRALVVVVTAGAGRAALFADPSPLQNRLLAHADNAALGLAVAGEPGRTVLFAESVHGYGAAEGFGAIPARWRLLLGALFVATLLWMWSRGRRLGPPEAASRTLAPARRQYVDALAGVLGRTRRPAEALAGMRAAVRQRVLRRAALPASAPAKDVRAAAGRAGLTPEEIGAVLDGGTGEHDILALGRALAKLGGDPAR